tara:strand:- start:90 stop:932 length:843 start_codon:yes stop_codon:yes gene_type:complete
MTIKLFFTKAINLSIKRPFFLIKRIYIFLEIIVNKSGRRKECNVCGKTLNNFLPYKNNYKLDKYTEMLDYVGSDIKNFSCVHCRSHDRERHLFMYFDKLNLWKEFSNKKILHFAPEAHLSKKIKEIGPSLYLKGDFNPDYLFEGDSEILNIDATDIKYNDEYFDFLICNHVLEHVVEYKKAFSEIYRVLTKNGIAILQTPYSQTLSKNFEDTGILTSLQRDTFYAQHDHVRVFSEKQFFNDLKEAGFSLNIQKHDSLFDADTSFRFGVNKLEDLIMVKKS